MDTDPVFESGRPRRPGKPSRIVGSLDPASTGASRHPPRLPSSRNRTKHENTNRNKTRQRTHATNKHHKTRPENNRNNTGGRIGFSTPMQYACCTTILKCNWCLRHRQWIKLAGLSGELNQLQLGLAPPPYVHSLRLAPAPWQLRRTCPRARTPAASCGRPCCARGGRGQPTTDRRPSPSPS